LASKPALQEVNFLAVMLPEGKPENGAFGDSPVTTPLAIPGWAAVKIAHAAGSDVGFFKTGNTEKAGEFVTDAGKFTVSYDKAGTLRMVYFEGSSITGHGIGVTADQPVIGTLAKHDATAELEIKSESGCSIQVALSGKPAAVQLDGKAF